LKQTAQIETRASCRKLLRTGCWNQPLSFLALKEVDLGRGLALEMLMAKIEKELTALHPIKRRVARTLPIFAKPLSNSGHTPGLIVVFNYGGSFTHTGERKSMCQYWQILFHRPLPRARFSGRLYHARQQ
jgi:hypothetical protein